MRRDIFSEEHEMFRAQVRRFVDTEIEPKVLEWNRVGMSDRASWRAGIYREFLSHEPGDLQRLS